MSLTLWQPITLEEGRPYPWRCGPFRLWLKRSGHDCLSAVERAPFDENSNQVPAGAAFYRFCGLKPWTHLDAEPALPNRPLIVRPSDKLIVPPGGEARLFLAIPLFVQLNVGGKPTDNSLTDKQTLSVIPSHVLSDTWFGDPVSGELGYGLKIPATRDPEELPRQPNLVYCPLVVKNRDTQPLVIERVCVRGEFLRIFQGVERLWTPEITLEQTDRSGMGLVSYVTEAPPEAGASPVMLSEYREKPHKGGLLRRTFGGAATLFLD